MLADVRNGSGFAGIDTGDRIVPISQPRGVPDDVSKEFGKEIESWDIDGHSHSWFSLAELLAVDWDQPITHRMWVRQRRDAAKQEDPDTFAERWQKYANQYGERPPQSYWSYEACGMSSEGQGASGWRTVEWAEPWWRAAGEEWMGCLLRMARLSQGYAETVRIVFFFDN
jgi:hypothetical protein